MALYILDGGCAFEQAIMERGRGNTLFSFLFELGSKEHTYYVWRLYSFAQVHLVTLPIDRVPAQGDLDSFVSLLFRAASLTWLLSFTIVICVLLIYLVNK